MTTTTPFPRPAPRPLPDGTGRRQGRRAATTERVVLALLLLLALVCVMLLDGRLRAEVGGDQRVRTGTGSSDVPEDILDGGPIVTFRGGQATTVSVLPGRSSGTCAPTCGSCCSPRFCCGSSGSPPSPCCCCPRARF